MIDKTDMNNYIIAKTSPHSIYTGPKHVGYMIMDRGVKLALYKKPNWFHRKMMKICFGFVWEDIGDNEHE